MNHGELKYLLEKYNLTPNKVRGQNFLISDSTLDQIIKAADIKEDDIVMEVGPGLGALTARLVTSAKKVFSFEVDKNFRPALDKLTAVSGNLEIIWQDILTLNDKKWAEKLGRGKKYKIVANIPYYLTGKFIQKFLTAENKPESMTLLVQKEVAERMVAKDKKQSLLSLSVALYADAKIICRVPAGKFYPQPKVDSAVIKIFDIRNWPNSRVDEKFTWQIIKRGFAQKRKKLANNIATDPNFKKDLILAIFKRLNLSPDIRAEKLSPENWLHLCQALKKGN